jgi:hypothetical protein
MVNLICFALCLSEPMVLEHPDELVRKIVDAMGAEAEKAGSDPSPDSSVS